MSRRLKMTKESWDCEIDGEKIKIIRKAKNAEKWWKTKPLSNGYSDGIHIVEESNQLKTVHADHYYNQKDDGKTLFQNYQLGSAIGSPSGTYINNSGAVRTIVIPKENTINRINTIQCSGSFCIITDISGYVLYGNIYR